MFALHAQHRELENRRKTAQIFYKKVAAKRFAKVLDRLGRKQSKQQIFPLFDALRLTVQADSGESSTAAALARSHRSALCRTGRFCPDPEAQHPQPTAHPDPRHRLLPVDAERFAQGTAARNRGTAQRAKRQNSPRKAGSCNGVTRRAHAGSTHGFKHIVSRQSPPKAQCKGNLSNSAGAWHDQ